MKDAADETSRPDPEDLSLWALHCYCPNAKRTPHHVVSDGNNGQILYAARHGVPRDQVDISDARLSELLEFRLLERDGERLRTAFPVLGVHETAPLRAALRRLATPLVDAGGSGTNFYRLAEDLTLVAVWSKATLHRLHDLATTPGMAQALRDRHVSAITDAQGRRRRVRLDDGRSAIPLVGVGDVLDELAAAVAAPVSAFLLSRACQEAHGHVSTDDRAVATVIIAHELIWEITERLIARGACTRAPQGEDLTALLFLLADRSS
jgi:hypothetical protein